VRRAGLPAVILVCACLAATAQATQSVTLHATLTPELLGQGTTVGFGFTIASPAGRVPAPLTGVDLRYPGNLGIALSGLGLATCSVEALEALGPEGCSAESRMGYGVALAEIQAGTEIIRETAPITVVRAPTQEGHLSLLFYADGGEPVSAQIVFAGSLLPATAPFGGSIHIRVPVVPSVPGAPDVAVVQVRSTLGPQHITYYERLHGRTVAYQPRGVVLPDSCPRGGFPFAADFTFIDGSHARAHTAVSCPRLRSALGKIGARR
jgi:hypothetical protein